MPCLYDSRAIAARISDLLAESGAMQDLAISEQRELTPDEDARFNTIMDEIGDAEARTGLHAQLDRAKKFEALRAAAGKPRNAVPPGRLGNSGGSGGDGGDEVPIRVRHIMPRLKAYREPRAAYDASQWLLAVRGNQDSAAYCSRNGIAIRAAATEGTNSAGGYLVPDPMSSAIQEVMDLYGVAARMGCRVIEMTADTLSVPKRLSGLTVDYPGEAAAIDLTDKSWTNVSLAVVKRATLSKISTELTQDSAINVVDDLTTEIGAAFGLQRDNELINGDGTGTYGSETGLISAIHANAVVSLDGASQTAFSNTDMADINALIAALPEKFHPGASFLMRRGTWDGVVVPLILAAGGATTADYGGGLQPSLMGMPVYFSDYMPTTAAAKFVMFLGQWRNAVMIGERAGTSVAVSTDYAFNEDVVTVRATRRYDINVHSLGTAVGDRAYVGLKTDAS